jgi:cellobiose-specific phosphotransferase system component IIB
LDVSLAESPSLSEQKSRDSLNRNIIVDVLSDPVVIPPQIEMITDEIAEIVTNHAFNVVRIDDSQSALASFQRVSGSTFNSSM